MSVTSRSRLRWLPVAVVLAASVAVGTYVVLAFAYPDDVVAQEKEKGAPRPGARKAPELEGGIAWLNTGKPLTMKDLKGKVVLLDFWTLCCINCIHVMPDLAKLEKKWEKELVVIGVHSAKFENEKNSESIRKAILRYDIRHPVVNDADQKIWDAYGSQSWPTFVLVDTEGNYIGQTSGEGKFDVLDAKIAELVEAAKKNKTLNEEPMRFDTAKFRDKVDSPLFFPGKVLADAKSDRVFIADSTNHRVVITDLKGNKVAVAGVGTPGKKDGAFAEASFDDPQGMALSGDTLYVADRKNHLLRELDLKAKTVKTIAGTGVQGHDRGDGGPALTTGLNSPWSLHLAGDKLFIAMAGHHQLWTMSLADKTLKPFAGDGAENIKDGPHEAARFAQPSGLASDGTNLYVADCEVSAIRKVPMNGQGRVTTLVGRGLFDFGDRDGPGRVEEGAARDTEAQLQHAIGVAFHDGTVYVADTYNSKIKAIKDGAVTTFVGGGKEPAFNEPAGLSVSDGKLYVADTNAHRIRIVDLKTKAVSTLELKGVEAVKAAEEKK